MTLARRVARLEAEVRPRDAVLAWLAEAHAYPTLPEYIAAIRDAPREDWPLVRIAGQVEAAVRATTKGTPPEVWQAVRAAVGNACFLFELVLQGNLAAREVRDIEGLRWALLAKWSGLLVAQAELACVTRHGDPEHAAREGRDWHDALAFTLMNLYTEEAARSSLERRYLAGRCVLFPALAQEWRDLVERLEWLANHAEQLHGPVPGAPSADVAALRARAAEQAPARSLELADLARIEALDMLGERARAFAVLERLLSPMAPVEVEQAGASGEALPPPSHAAS